MRIGLFLIWVLTFAKATFAQNYSQDTRFWQAYGNVSDIVIDSTNHFAYIGGSFPYVGPPTPYGAILDSNNAVIENVSNPNYNVNCAISDGLGGWYIGGDFTKIGNDNRLRIAHIDSVGNVVDNLGTNGFSATVRTLSLKDSILFVGGDFDSYGSNIPRGHLAAIDLTTNSLHSWNPMASWRVNDLQIKDTLLFVVGEFSLIANSSQNGLAVFNTNTLTLLPYAPNPTGAILCAVIDSSFLYLGGTFATFDGQPRNSLAKLKIEDFSLQPWNPSVDGYVYALAVNDTNVFVGGIFNSINGINRVNLANTDKMNGQVLDLSFIPQTLSVGTCINELKFKDSLLLVGANYQTKFYDDFKHLFAINLNSGAIDPFFPHAAGTVNTISFSNQRMYVGGEFASAGGSYVNKIARFDLNTGELTRWRTKLSGSVSDLLLDDSILIAVGSISRINQLVCGNVGAIRTSDGQPIAWPVSTNDNDVNTSDNVKSVIKMGDTIIISGEFNSVNGQNRNQIAGVRFSNGALLNWNPNLPYGTGNLAVSGSYFYSAGPHAFRFSKSTLQQDPNWQFEDGIAVNQIMPCDTTIILLGEPYALGPNNIYHSGLTILDTVTGNVLNEQESLLALWKAGYVSNNSIFLSGVILDPITPLTQYQAYEVNKISRDTLSGPYPRFGGNNVECIQKFGSKLFLGGNFAGYNGWDFPGFVVFDVCEPTINPVIEQVADCNSYTWAENNVTYYNSGIYSDLGTNSLGCDSVVFLNLTIERDSIVDNQTHCVSYTWINGVTYTASNDTAFVNYTNSAGCDSTIWLNLTIVPYPVAGISYNNGTLTATETGTYQWLDCLSSLPVFGATNSSFIPSQNGTYAVIVGNGSCSDTSACVQVFDLGISELDNGDFDILPNPANSNVMIRFSSSEAELTVYDLQGKVVLKDRIQNNGMVSLQNFERGVYLFDFKNSQGHCVQRVVKQ
jgi:hypothetical protein